MTSGLHKANRVQVYQQPPPRPSAVALREIAQDPKTGLQTQSSIRGRVSLFNPIVYILSPVWGRVTLSFLQPTHPILDFTEFCMLF